MAVKKFSDRTLEGHDQPAIAPPQRLRAPSVVVRLDFLWRGDDSVFVFVLVSRAPCSGRGDCSRPCFLLVLDLRGRQTSDDVPITAK